jgi:hypothetical protein
MGLMYDRDYAEGPPDPILSPEWYCDEEERQEAIAQMRADGQLPPVDVQPCGHPAIDWAQRAEAGGA